MYTKLYCPFTCCPQHEGAEKPRGMESKYTLRDHLIKSHKEELYKLNDDELESNTISIKDLRSNSDQEAISYDDLVKRIKKIYKKG